MEKIATSAAKSWLRKMTLIDLELESRAIQHVKMCNLRVSLMYASAKIRDMVNEIILDFDNEIENLIKQRNEIADAIAKVKSHTMRVALEQRYIYDKSISEIAEVIHYSTRQAKRLMEAAIDNVINNLNDETENNDEN